MIPDNKQTRSLDSSYRPISTTEAKWLSFCTALNNSIDAGHLEIRTGCSGSRSIRVPLLRLVTARILLLLRSVSIRLSSSANVKNCKLDAEENKTGFRSVLWQWQLTRKQLWWNAKTWSASIKMCAKFWESISKKSKLNVDKVWEIMFKVDKVC